MASLMSMRRLGVFGSPRVAPRVVPVAAPSLSAARAPARGALVIVAAEKGPQKMDSAVKRAKLAEERRVRNKARKSAIATRTKKMLKLADNIVRTPTAATPEQIASLDVLMTEAYKEIDKAVKVGTMHANTGDRRKARVAKHRREALIAVGAYTPKADQPGYRFYELLQAKAAKVAAAQAATAQ